MICKLEKNVFMFLINKIFKIKPFELLLGISNLAVSVSWWKDVSHQNPHDLFFSL